MSFNFSLTNKALTDMNVSDTEFRTLYLIANNCSMNNTDSIEMYNAYLMEKLRYSESTAKRSIKVLEEKGYISVKRATKKRTPNIITLSGIKNECKDEVRNAVRKDTLYKNIDKNIDNIQSIQSNSNEDNGIPFYVYCEEREKKASYDISNLNEDNLIVGDNTNGVIHSTDIVNDNLNEDNKIDYEVNAEQQIAKEKASYNSNDFNEDNEKLRGIDIVDNNSSEEIQGIRSIETETDNSNEGDEIDAMFEAYERGLIEAAEQSSTPRQGNNPNGIDWNAWRERFEQCKLGMLNAKCKTELDLWEANCTESLKFAKKHMRPERYERQRVLFDRWNAASEPYFYYNKQKQQSAMKGTTPKPCKKFDNGDWHSFQCEFEYIPEKREETARKMVQYLEDCGRSPKEVIKKLKSQYGITL